MSLTEDLKLGIGINPPFGLATDYGSDSLDLDVAYVHIFSADSTINNSTATEKNLNGEFKSSADIISLGLNWKL